MQSSHLYIRFPDIFTTNSLNIIFHQTAKRHRIYIKYIEQSDLVLKIN